MGDRPSLYERAGGYDAIYALTEYAIAKLMRHDDVGEIWQHMSEDRVYTEIQHFVDFVCEKWGGPQKYMGRDMIAVHRGMGITEAHWKQFFEVLDDAYEHFQVSSDLKEEINAFMKSFKPHVVGSPTFRDVVREAKGTTLSGGLASYGVKWP
jgi:hemoglobin